MKPLDEGPIEPDPVIEAYKRGVDVTLIRENLKLTPHERLLRLIELHRVAEELRRAGEDSRTGGAPDDTPGGAR
jgi:hypothetical protein